MDLGLSGKRAIVTGGSRGIGKAIALQLALEGADVVIAARGKDALVAAASELSHLTGRRVVPAVADTGNKQSVDALIRLAAEELGGIDVLVNNAAIPVVVAVHPGATRTERTDGATAEKLGAFTGIGRIVDAAEVADLVAFLASPKNVTIHGEAISAGGGTPGAIRY